MTTHTINCNEFPFFEEASRSSMHIQQGTIELDFSKILLLDDKSESDPLYQKLIGRLRKVLTFTREEYKDCRSFINTFDSFGCQGLRPKNNIDWIDDKMPIHITPRNIVALLLASNDSAMPSEWRIALDKFKLNANVLNYLLQHPDTIPRKWKKKSYIHFLGSNWMGNFPMLFKQITEHKFKKEFHDASEAACSCEYCAIALYIP